MEPNIRLEKKLNKIAIVITLIVLALIGLMRRPEYKIKTDIDFSFLPAFHSSINALTAIVLIIALVFIKQKNMKAHRNSIYLAMALSLVFLLSYVTYHFTSEEVKYCGEGMSRTIYLGLLISHIVLAALALPLVLFTFIRAYTGQFDRHRKLAKWAFPIWLYVAITGPVCYLMLRPCFQ